MATTPIGGRLPNLNRKGTSPCVAISATATSSSSSSSSSLSSPSLTVSSSSLSLSSTASVGVGGNNNNIIQSSRRAANKDHQDHQRRQGEKSACRDSKASTVAANVGETDTATTNVTNNFEYDDNEWDIGIGDLIIDLDADIEKTRDEKLSSGNGMASTPASAATATTNQNHQSQQNATQHNATVQNCSSSSAITATGNSQSSSSSSSSSSLSSSSSPSCGVNSTSGGQSNSVNSSNASSNSNTSGNANSGNGPSSKQQSGTVNAVHINAGNPGKMAVEHSATVDKGLKMKIKRTKPGTKTSEAKHEIVKSNEINGTTSSQETNSNSSSSNSSTSSSGSSTSSSSSTSSQNSVGDVTTNNSSSSNKSKPHSPASAASGPPASSTVGSKRGSSGHRRDKARDKHEKPQSNSHGPQQSKPEMNGTARPVSQSQNSSGAAAQSQGPTPAATAPQQTQGPPPSSRTGFPVSQGAGPPVTNATAPCPPPSPASATAAGSAAKPEQTKVATVPGSTLNSSADESMDTSTCSPPPVKKLKTSNSEPKDMSDVCVGTSVGTITEPECLGPCEPGTSVTLEGIVWHETEGGVLVVNVTWRGKTYVGTLLDCTRHDWAPPRFCDSPTSDLDARTPKGRGKRGRAAANATPGNDLSNFTETRSSVHSKLRNGGKGRRGPQGSPAASPSPAAFVPPRPDPAAKRKSRAPEEEEKSKRRAPPPTPPSGSPPASPVLLECPEPNCSKKYKHINGLKYHQSHAHGSADDEDTKEGVTSMSENDESNIEAPSPATPVKSPVEKPEGGTPVRATSPPANAIPSETPTPPPRVPSPTADQPTPLLADKTSIVKPGVLRFGQEDLPAPTVAVQQSPRPQIQQVPPANPPQSPSPHPSQSPRPVPSPHPNPSIPQPINIPQPPQPTQVVQHQTQNQLLQAPQNLSSQNLSSQSLQQAQSLQSPQPQLQPAHQLQPIQHPVQTQLGQPAPAHMVHQSGLQQQQQQSQQSLQALNQHPGLQSLATQIGQQPGLQNTTSTGHPVQSHMQYPNVGLHTKMPQFKVKPTAALMPEQDKNKDPRTPKPQGYKKKSRKSPGGSPHPSPLEAPIVDSAREDVQSPAYSDISDDGAPVLEVESADKLKQGQEKDVKPGTQTHLPPHFGMYPYYGQPPYLVPSVQDKSGEQKPSDLTPKQDVKPLNIPQMPTMASLQNSEKDKKELNPPPQQQPHYYGGYGSYIPPGYPYQPQSVAQAPPPQQQNQQEVEHEQKVKIKQESQQQQTGLKDKQHENHQILKESIEMKSQMSPYHVYHGSQSQRAPPAPGPVQDDRRYYLYPGDQRRKDESVKAPQQAKPPPPSPKHQPKQEKPQDLGKSEDSKNKQEGVKPTMETQGPPPPPTSQYAYIHPGYMPPQHYGGIPFDPAHAVYRGLSPMLVPGPYSGNPYLHQLPRYHAPEDLSRPPGGKALDLLQHHASQYYSAHKIHELQERALKSPTPKTSAASASPSAAGPTPARPPSGPPTSAAGGPGPPPGQGQQQGSKQQSGGNPQQSGPGDSGNGNLGKDNRSPPPQRHVHTHHHTHVGLGYPLLTGQYPAPYGAAVLASQQAAAVAASVISPFPPK